MRPVLFVCVHNSGRSQMAEAFYNHLAGGRSHSVSAGTIPADEVQPEVVQVMAEVGIDISKRTSKLLTPEMIERAGRLITMGCSVEEVCPATFVPAEDWELDDPKGQPLEKVSEIRDEIRRRVEGLLAELEGDTPK